MPERVVAEREGPNWAPNSALIDTPSGPKIEKKALKSASSSSGAMSNSTRSAGWPISMPKTCDGSSMIGSLNRRWRCRRAASSVRPARTSPATPATSPRTACRSSGQAADAGRSDSAVRAGRGRRLSRSKSRPRDRRRRSGVEVARRPRRRPGSRRSKISSDAVGVGSRCSWRCRSPGRSTSIALMMPGLTAPDMAAMSSSVVGPARSEMTGIGSVRKSRNGLIGSVTSWTFSTIGPIRSVKYVPRSRPTWSNPTNFRPS